MPRRPRDPDAVEDFSRSPSAPTEVEAGPGAAALDSVDWSVHWNQLEPSTQAQLQYLLEQTAPLLNLPYVPSLKQMQAHLANCYTMRHPLLWGGGMRGGKSSYLCAESIRETRELDETRVLLGRFTLTAFTDTTLQTLLQFIDLQEYDWNRSAHTFLHRQTGSIIKYAQLGSAADLQRLGSSEFSFIGPDEATEVPRPVFEMLQTRLGHPAAKGQRLKFRLTCNPNPGWIKEDFITNPKPGYYYLPALVTDNPYQYAGYVEDMRAAMTPERFKAWILGDWNAFVPEMAALPADLIDEMVHRTEEEDRRDVVQGIDVGHLGSDETSIWERRGLVFRKVDSWARERTDETYRRWLNLYATRPVKPRQVNIDIDGIGVGLYDQMLRGQLEGDIPRAPHLVIVGVHAQGKPTKEQPIGNPLRYANVKSECFFTLRALGEANRGDLPNDPLLVADLTTPYYDTPGGRVIIEKKELVRQRLGRSPNDGDALLLTLYQGRRDEIAGRETQPLEELTPVQAQRLEQERARAEVEQRTASAIKALTGADILKKKRNRLGY